MIGTINKIQEFSTKDGPGIRTTVFLKGCNLRCKWCANPETLDKRPSLMYHENKCQLCKRCVDDENIRFIDNKLKIDYSRIPDIDMLVDVCPNDAYEKIGYDIDSRELVDKLSLNKVFFNQTNGGITFSGGEAMLQSDFISECIDLLHKMQIKVAVDTAGNISNDVFRKVINKADLVLYDLKIDDDDLHSSYTGTGNKAIRENYLDIETQVIVRLIIVPGINDNFDDIRSRIDYALLNKNLIQIDLLKYHSLGKGKYKALGLEYQLDDSDQIDDNLMNKVSTYLDSLNLKWTIGGN